MADVESGRISLSPLKRQHRAASQMFGQQRDLIPFGNFLPKKIQEGQAPGCLLLSKVSLFALQISPAKNGNSLLNRPVEETSKTTKVGNLDGEPCATQVLAD